MMKIIANNKKAYFDYFISDKIEAGIVLEGSEVKSVRDGGINISEGYVRVINGELFLINAYIKPFDKSSSYTPDARKSRKLLLNKREIIKYETAVVEKGLTILPLKVYLNNNLVKVEIGIGKGKKLYDKREVLKEKTIKKEIDTAIKKIKIGR
jgi:SsrA-binding protein